CPNPSCPIYAVAATAPTQAGAALARWLPPCQRAATPTAGVATLAGNKVGCGRPAADPLCGAVLQAEVLVGDYRPYGLATVGIPCGLALVATGRPLVGSLGRVLAMGGWPYMGASHG
ncbi:hypothetical protein B296_00042817, partial [Ensete ventricosum]